MKLTTTTFWQIVACLLQILNLVDPLVTSPKGKAIVAATIGCIQVLMHQFAGRTNPDGTPAAVPYVKDKEKG